MQVGQQIRLARTVGLPRLAIVREISHRDDGRALDSVLVTPVLHEDADGNVWEPGDRYRVVVNSIGWLPVEEGETIAPNVVQATRKTEEISGQPTTWHGTKAKATVHAVADGGPSCGATLRRAVHKPERYDEWNKRTMRPRDEESVWVGTFRAITCKRCLVKQAKEEG